MKQQYFNRWEFLQAFSLVDNNPLEAKRKYEQYLEKYPKDYSAYTYYIAVLITIGKFYLAEKTLNELEKIYNEDKSFLTELDKLEILEKEIFIIKLRLLLYKEKYQELYDFCLKNEYKIKAMNLNAIFLYCNKKLNKISNLTRNHKSYLFRQIIEYDENDFLEHIKKHLADFNADVEVPNKNIFKPDFPIYEIVEEVKKYIPSNKKLMTGLYQDEYVFKYDSCGRDNNKLVDYFKIISFHNTKNFITMVPVVEGENLPHVDLNYLIEPSNNKIKQLTQTQKFNKKYRKKESN